MLLLRLWLLYSTLLLKQSLNFDPLHATVQLGEGFNLVKFKLARFHCCSNNNEMHKITWCCTKL